MAKREIHYRPLTKIEAQACRALDRCTFLPGTPHKRFARDMGRMIAHSESPLISDGQAAHLWRLVYRYRRQIRDNALIDHAKKMNDAAAVNMPASKGEHGDSKEVGSLGLT